MQPPIEDIEKRYSNWLVAYRVTQSLLIANMGLFFFNFFTEWKSAYQFVYGATIWPAIGVALAFTLILSKAFHAAHFYYALLAEHDTQP
ncbi:hypothetical protein D3C85_982900 [compost metagenome]